MKHILIVDDNKINLSSTKNALVDSYKTTAVTMGRQALAFLETKQCDLLLLDIEMPEMDGYEVFEKVREMEQHKNLPIVFLTGNTDLATKEKCMAMGASDIIIKPARPDVLLEVVGAILEPEKKAGVTPSVEVTSSAANQDFPALEGLRFDMALMLMRDKEQLIETIKDFVRLSEDNVQKLEHFYEDVCSADEASKERAFKAYRVQVHSMKTSAAMVGAIALSEVARWLERSSAGLEMEPLAMTALFLKEWRHITDILNDAFVKTGEKSDVSYEMVREYLRLLLQKAEEMDVDAMDAIAEGLSAYEYKEDENVLIQAICSDILNLDYESCITHTQELQNKIGR